MPGSLASALASAWEVSDLVSMHFEAKKRTKTGVSGQKRDLKKLFKGKNTAQKLSKMTWKWSKTALGCVPTYAEGLESLKRSKYSLSE